MRTLPLTDPQAINTAVAVLRAGGTVVHPTETCYGLACDLSNPTAVRRVFTLKQRPEHQPISALFASIEQAKEYVQWNNRAEELAAAHLPGALTLILPMRADAPLRLFPFIVEKSEARNPKHEINSNIENVKNKKVSDFDSRISNFTLGVRVSSHPFALALTQAYGSPLSTTSANIHGQKNPYAAEEILSAWLENGPDLFVDAGTLPEVPPSTIIDLTGESPSTLRIGRIEK